MCGYSAGLSLTFTGTDLLISIMFCKWNKKGMKTCFIGGVLQEIANFLVR